MFSQPHRHQPRSILKPNHSYASPPPQPAPIRASAVRFPSSPKMSTVHFTHCPGSYDRSPIVVLPNSCALPDRGCREVANQQYAQQQWGNHVHPSVYERMVAGERDRASREDTYNGTLLPPPLTHDDGSSEESDGIASPPPELVQHHYLSPSQSHLYTDPLSHPPIPGEYSDDHRYQSPSEYSLSFLPHAHPYPSPPRRRTSGSSEKLPKPKRASLEASSPMQRSASFGNSWDESSCLGGF